jgi:Family of unknown function (DUF6804)
MDQLLDFLDHLWKTSWVWMKDNYRVPLVLLCLMILKYVSEAIGPLKWRFRRTFPGNSVPMPPAIASSALCFAASIWRQRTLFEAQLLVACAGSIYLAYSFAQVSKREGREMEAAIEIWKSPDCAELDKQLIESEIADCQAALRTAKRGCEVWMWIMAGAALLFNPVFPLHFTRNQWVWVDVVAGVIFLLALGLSGKLYRVSPLNETDKVDARSSG